MPCQVVRRAVKALFIIDGVAERKTSHMLQNSLASRLDFPCYVQVVANYVLAFDLAMQQGFDVLVLPHATATDGYSKADFVEDVTNTCGFSSNLVYTVDHDSASHQLGRTIRSTRTGGYMVDDLIAALTCVAKKSTNGKKATKRSHQDCQPAAHHVASEQGHGHRRKQARPALEQPYRVSADEIAYWQHYHWQMQWQRYHQAQAHADVQAQRQVYPEYAPYNTADPRVSSAISATPTSPFSPVIPHPHLHNHHYHLTQHHHQLYAQHHNHHQQHQAHSHPFPSSHPTQFPNLFMPHPSEMGHHTTPNAAQHQERMQHHHYELHHHQQRQQQQQHASLHCASHEEKEEQEALTKYGNLAADAHVCGSDSSCGCTTTESLDSNDSLGHRDSIDIDIFDFDVDVFNI